MSRLITNAIRSTSASADAITFDNSGKPAFPNGGAGKILHQTFQPNSELLGPGTLKFRLPVQFCVHCNHGCVKQMEKCRNRTILRIPI